MISYHQEKTEILISEMNCQGNISMRDMHIASGNLRVQGFRGATLSTHRRLKKQNVKVMFAAEEGKPTKVYKIPQNNLQIQC